MSRRARWQPRGVLGGASKTPSSAMHARNRSGEWWSTGKSLERRFSPPPSQSLGRGWPLRWNALGSSLPPPTCSTNGTRASARRAQTGSRSTCVGEKSPGASEGTHTAATPSSSASSSVASARAGSFRGEEPDRLEPGIGGAESNHGPVERLGPSVEDVRVVSRPEVAERERREDELRVDAERVEHAGAHVGVERPRRQPALGTLQDLGPDLLVPVRIPQVRELRHQLLGAGTRSEQAERLEAAPHGFVGELAEPIRRLHKVAVGVEYRSIHRAPRRCQVVRPA